MITKRWINVNGEGYYEVSNGISIIRCDENELLDTIRELETEISCLK